MLFHENIEESSKRAIDVCCAYHICVQCQLPLVKKWIVTEDT